MNYRFEDDNCTCPVCRGEFSREHDIISNHFLPRLIKKLKVVYSIAFEFIYILNTIFIYLDQM